MTAAPAGTAPRAPELVLFDLDGTLADTFPDLDWALTAALAEHGLPPGARAAVRAQVSRGAGAMTDAALAGRTADRTAIRARFLDLYREHVAVRTALFDGVQEVLDSLDRRGIGAGVVTNKLSAYTDPLVDGLRLRSRLRCVVSGDTAPRAKPHPDPLLYAARLGAVSAGACVYVGDAASDVAAARAAGMPVAVAAYGYLAHDDDPELWLADRLVRHPLELLDWLGIAA